MLIQKWSCIWLIVTIHFFFNFVLGTWHMISWCITMAMPNKFINLPSTCTPCIQEYVNLVHFSPFEFWINRSRKTFFWTMSRLYQWIKTNWASTQEWQIYNERYSVVFGWKLCYGFDDKMHKYLYMIVWSIL